MQRFGKRRLATGATALTIGVAALGGCLLTAGSAVAAVPGGVACQPTDGKITGRGATLEGNAENNWWNAYDSDFCGATPEAPADQAGSNEGIYNYPGAVSSSNTGAGKGLIGANCRTDAYVGASVPYTEAQLTSLDGAPGLNVNSLGPCPSVATLASPFAPDASTNTVYPNVNDQAANLMSFPVAVAAVAVIVNLPASACGGTAPTSIELTGSQVSGIEGGSILNWNSTALTGNNPSLTACNVPIVRIVREDSAGQTTIYKGYLGDVDASRSTATCAPGTTWASYSGTTSWPESAGGAASSTCSQVTLTSSSGGAQEVSQVNSTVGAIGYADYGDVAASGDHGLIAAAVQNGAGTAYEAPVVGLGANCNASAVSPPDNASPVGIVGLDSNENWATDNATVNGTGNHNDANDVGTSYPICGLAWDLVYSGLSSTSGSAIANLTADQRRTLYSYVTFVLSSLGQSLLPNEYDASVPAAWLQAELSGFQSNY